MTTVPPLPPVPPLRITIHNAALSLLAAHCDDNLDEARLESDLLYGEAAGLDRAQVIARGGDTPDVEALARFEALLARRLQHEPLAYILGRRECYGMTFIIGRGALIPRPETELLIERTLAAVREHPSARRLVRVADVGTGSGVIALAVAKHALMAKVYGLDRSSRALAIAGENRKRFDLLDRVVLLVSDLFESLPERVEVVTANLPYIPQVEIEALAPEVRDWEPGWALNGGRDGLDLVRRLIYRVPEHLVAGPRAVLLEVGAGPAQKVARTLARTLAGALGGDAVVAVHRDFAGIERVVEARVGY